MCRWTCQPVTMPPRRCCAAILSIGLSMTCFGQADPPTGETESPPRLLLLFDGRVIIGDISEVAGGYAVRRAEGTITLPFEFVRLTATTLLNAYEKQRDNLENPNAQQHLTLARWCLRHRLQEQAVTELEAALKLEPFRTEARELLQLIAAAEQSAEQQRTGPEPATTNPVEQTSAGISPDNHLEFIRRIQPLLVNKCGNATCHGSASSNSLRLHNVRTGRRHQRIHSDQNLAMVLEFVDADFPLHSPLLRQPQDPDSLAHRGVFAGALGEEQVRLLHDWIHEVAVDRQLAFDDVSPIDNDPRLSDDPLPAIEQTEHAEESVPLTTGPRIIDIPRKSDDRRSPLSSELLRNILDEERHDSFDPGEFNRRVHGIDP